jgi:3-oxoacyl-[acyl-carrier protein] reductase
MKRLEGKRILVTGASRGIGAGIAQQCAREGAQVAITYSTRPDAAQAILSSLEGSNHLCLQLNIAEESSVQTAFEQIQKDWNGLDGLVNNAGVTRDQLILRMKAEDFDFVMQTNLRGTFLCARSAAKMMLKARKGALVHITSVIGEMGNAGQASYAAAKAGIEGLSKSIALELASRNIRSNCVAPGYIGTEMTGALTDEQRAAILEKVPLHAIGTPEDVALATCFLLSDEAKYITSHTLSVNGGMYM